MKTCPNCGEALFYVNATSQELECLTKSCGYSTIVKVGIEIVFSEEEKSVEREAVEEERKFTKVPCTQPKTIPLFNCK